MKRFKISQPLLNSTVRSTRICVLLIPPLGCAQAKTNIEIATDVPVNLVSATQCGYWQDGNSSGYWRFLFVDTPSESSYLIQKISATDNIEFYKSRIVSTKYVDELSIHQLDFFHSSIDCKKQPENGRDAIYIQGQNMSQDTEKKYLIKFDESASFQVVEILH